MSRWLKVAALLVLILYPIWAVCFLINWFMLGHPLRSRNFGGGLRILCRNARLISITVGFCFDFF